MFIEESLLPQTDLYQTILSSIADSVIVTDHALRITYLNTVSEALTG